ncbi:arginyl-tRNA synthetase [Gurleya vavrai]
MKFEFIFAEILLELSKFVDIKPSSLSHSKNVKGGEYNVHKSNIKDEEIIDRIINEYQSENIQRVELINDYINFFVDMKKLSKKILKMIFEQGDKFGHQKEKEGLYVVEYSSPNIAKRFHPGHFRNTILGNFINNLVKANGYKTHTINYLGDWGKQFGIVGVGFEKYGSEEKMLQDPIKHLYEIYVQMHTDIKNDPKIDEEAKAWFTDLENGNKEKLKMWKRCREMSVEKYKELYKMLNCSFDEYSGESLYAEKGKTEIDKIEKKDKLIIDEVESENVEIAEETTNSNPNIDEKKIDEGNLIDVNNNETSSVKNIGKNISIADKKIIQFDKNDNSKYIKTKHGKICVIKNDGSTLYSTRDIGAGIDRFERLKPIKMLYVVAYQQDLYFKQLFDIFEMIGYGMKDGEFICEHVNYGMVNGMSTRKGKVALLEDIISEAKNVMLKKMKEKPGDFEKIKDVDKTCLDLALSALVVQDFSTARINDYNFDIKKSTAITGNTGPYLQYFHCRLVSLEENNSDLMAKYDLKQHDFLHIFENEFDENSLDEKFYKILWILMKYPDIVEKCMENFEPSTMVNYLMDLAKKVSAFIKKLKVKDVEESVAFNRLFFYKAVRIVICNGIKILGLNPVERM